MSNFVGRDVTAVLYLEEPETTALRQRTYVHDRIEPGATWRSDTWEDERILGVFVVVSTTGQSAPVGTVSCKYSCRYYESPSSYVDYEKSKSDSYRGCFGFSMVELMDLFSSFGEGEQSSTSIEITNNTDQALVVTYVTVGPLAFFDHRNGLLSMDCGDRMGSDERYPDFGLCRAYGSFSFKDDGQRFRELTTNPYDYGMGYFARNDMRVEFFIGDNLTGVFEVEELTYSEDGRTVSAQLKSPFDRLDSYQTYGKMVVTENQTLSSFVNEFLSYSEDTIGVPLEMFNYSELTNVDALSDVRLGVPIVGESVSISTFFDYVAQASATSILLYASLTTSMKYRFRVVSWFPEVRSPIAYQGSRSMPAIGPGSIMGSALASPVPCNMIDKITYMPYEVSVEEKMEEVSTVFDLVRFNPIYVNGAIDVGRCEAHWLEKSGLPSVPSGDVSAGARNPMPSDLSYNSSTDKYEVDYGWLENRTFRSMTRGFLWRFEVVTDYSSINSLSRVSDNFALRLRMMESAACYKAHGSSYSNTALFSTPSASRTTVPSGMVYYPKYANPDLYYTDYVERFSVRATNAFKSTVMKCPYLFDSFHSSHFLYANMAKGKYLKSDSVIMVTLGISFWYTTVFGGTVSQEIIDSSASQENLDYAGAMSVVSPWKINGGHAHIEADSYSLHPTTWEESRATKMSEYICLEHTAMQTYEYRKPDDESGEPLAPKENTVWTGSLLRSDPTYSAGKVLWPFNTDWPPDRNGCVGTWLGADGYKDSAIDSIYGVNSDYDTGFRVFWGCEWYHTGDDADARGGYQQVSTGSYVAGDVAVDAENGQLAIRVSLPSPAALKSAIVGGQDNFIGTPSSEGSVGQKRADNANAYCSFWNPFYAYSVRNSNGDFVPASKLVDAATGNSLDWMTGRPFYGFVVKDAKATVRATYYSVSRLDAVVRQVGRYNKYNYNLETNPLMASTSVYVENGEEHPLVDEWADCLAAYFEDGRKAVKVKSKVEYVATSASDYLYRRLCIVGDKASQSDVSVVRRGAAEPIDGTVYEWFVRGVEHVYEDGALYENVELMESW